MGKYEFKMYIDIYEPMLNGEFGDTQPHEYLWKSDPLITDKEFGEIKNLIFEDIIFQACEIERFSNGELCIELNIEKNDEFCAVSNKYSVAFSGDTEYFSLKVWILLLKSVIYLTSEGRAVRLKQNI